MSHTTTLSNVILKDISAIKSAVSELNKKGIKCKLKENTKPRMYSTSQGPTCEYVLNLEEGQYDVGFKKQKNGTYTPVLDTYSNHVENQIGATCPAPYTKEGRAQKAIGKFMQEYSKAATINAALQQGYIPESIEQDKNGEYHITLTGV